MGVDVAPLWRNTVVTLERPVLVMCAAGTAENAETIARELVSQKLAACVQISPITSFYRWNGAVQHEPELLLQIKTTADRFAGVETLVKSLHTYELPELAMVDITGGSHEYLRWITESVH